MAARKSAKPKAKAPKAPRSNPQPQPAAAAVVYNRDVGRDGNTPRQT